MAKFILKWRYINGSKKAYAKNYLRYIATRDGVEKCDESWKHTPATQEQQELIAQLIKDFPSVKESFEYQDYISEPTKETASEFITKAIDENADLIGKKRNYVAYIAKRPHVEKQGSHGLFSQDDTPINLSEVAKTVANHEGLVWTTILSLRREDAERLGYNNANAWKHMLKNNVGLLAKSMGIPVPDLRWYAAFHNEGHHPHVHMVAYSVGKEPYVTEAGLIKLKGQYARTIFCQDLYQIYDELNAHRDDLRMEGKSRAEEISMRINNRTYKNNNVELLLKNLVRELEGYTGKKVYGYLPKTAKNLVNGIVDEMEKDSRIAEIYDLWYKQKEKIIAIYQDKLPERVPLSSNPEFKTIRNAIVKEAFELIEHPLLLLSDDEQSVDSYDHKGEEYSESPKENHYSYNQSQTVTNKKQSYTPLSIGLASLRLMGYLSRILVDDMEDDTPMHQEVDSKLMRKIREKKMNQGQKM